MADETTVEPSAEASSTKAKRKYTKKASKKVAKKAIKKAVKKAKGKGGTGMRYSQAIKDGAVAFINDNPGRGIIGKALKKYGVSYISLRNWLKNAGKGSKGKKTSKGVDGTPTVKAPVKGRPKASSIKAAPKSVPGDFDAIVAQIQLKRSEIKDLLKLLSQAV